MLNSLGRADEMRRRVLGSAILIILLIGSIFYVHSTTAAPMQDSSVEVAITCTFDTGARLSVRAHMLVNRINVFDTIYDRQAIEDMSASNPYIMGAIMLRLHDAVKTLVETAFLNAEVDTLNTMPSYQKPYFIDDFQVNLTSAYFQHSGSLNLTNVIMGFLDMGATVTYHFNLHVQQGWNATFLYALPNSMRLAYANTADTDPDTNTVTWMVRNWLGADAGKDAVLSVQSKNPTTPVSETEDISLEYIVDPSSVNNISFITSILIKKVDIRQYTMLPGFITGIEILPADGVRLCIDNGLFSWADLFEKTIQPIEQQTTPLIENSSFKQELSFMFQWDSDSTTNCSTPYNISHMDESPTLRANFKDLDVELIICQMPARAFFGLIHTGATASISSVDMNFGLGLEGVMYPYETILRLPQNITLDGHNVYIWNETNPLKGTFRSDLQPSPSYTAEHIETLIEIELAKMDLNILSVFTGKTELTASTKIKEDSHLYVIRRSERFSFSPKINITFLNADAVRLCIQENVFSEPEIDGFLLEKTESFQQRLSEILPGAQVKGIIDRTVFSHSLVWSGDISAMDGVAPVVVSNSATEAHTVMFNVSLWPVDVTLAPQRFTLQGLDNQSTTYRIVFPRGVTVDANVSSGKTLIKGTTNDGREYLELSFDAGSTMLSADVSCVLNVSPVYVLGLFLPCILVFFLLIVLVVVMYLLRKKKGGLRRVRGRRNIVVPEDNEHEPSEYGEQDYYVPPPPPSTKRRK